MSILCPKCKNPLPHRTELSEIEGIVDHKLIVVNTYYCQHCGNYTDILYSAPLPTFHAKQVVSDYDGEVPIESVGHPIDLAKELRFE